MCKFIGKPSEQMLGYWRTFGARCLLVGVLYGLSPIPAAALGQVAQEADTSPQPVDIADLLPAGASRPAVDLRPYQPGLPSRHPFDVQQQRALLDGLVRAQGAGVQPWRDLVAQATREGWHLSWLTIWAHPQRGDAFVEVFFYNAQHNYLPGGHRDSMQLWHVAPGRVQRLALPDHLSEDARLRRVTDVRGDGHLQLWFSKRGDGCEDDDSDVSERDLRCHVRRADVAQLEAGTLVPLTPLTTLQPRRRPLARPSADAGRRTPDAGLRRWMDAPHAVQASGLFGAENLRLWGTLLAESTGLDFGNGSEPRDRGDILSFTSKAYPPHSELTLVTLFHRLPGIPDTSQDFDADEAGFLVLLVDTAQRKIVRRYAGRQVVDAAVRIWERSLVLDTARYDLAPGVRAFGVRKNIGYSPCAAEGYSDEFLSLFVEEGRDTFRLVLDDLAMSAGRVVQEGNSCGATGEPPVWAHARLMLGIQPMHHEGWADLKVTASLTEIDGDATSSPGSRHWNVEVLQRQDGRYVCPGFCDPFKNAPPR